jgi:hypothetical protein
VPPEALLWGMSNIRTNASPGVEAHELNQKEI